MRVSWEPSPRRYGTTRGSTPPTHTSNTAHPTHRQAHHTSLGKHFMIFKSLSHMLSHLSLTTRMGVINPTLWMEKNET